MNNCHCDGLCKTWTDAGVFHKVQELYQEGVDIYQYFKCPDPDTYDEPRQTELNKHYKRVLVVQNKSNCDIYMNNIIDAIEFKNIKCQHCYDVLCQTIRLLSALNILRKYEVIGICDHCKKIIKNDSCECKHSIEVMKSFLNSRLRDWFQRTCKLPCGTRRERFRYDRAKLRASSKSERALEIDELFPDYSNISQRSKSAEIEGSNDYLNAFKDKYNKNSLKQLIRNKSKELSREKINSLDTEYVQSATVESKKDVSVSQKQIQKQKDIKDEQGNVSYKKLSDSGTKEIKKLADDFTTKKEKEKHSKAAKPSQVDLNNNTLKIPKTTKSVKHSSKLEEQLDNKRIISKVLKLEKETKESKQNDNMINNYNAKLAKIENGITKDSKEKEKVDSDYISKSTKTKKGATNDLKQKDKGDNDPIYKLSKTEKKATKDLKRKDQFDDDSILKLSKREREATKDLKKKDKFDSNSILKLSKTENEPTKDLEKRKKIDDDSNLKLPTIEKGAKIDLSQNYKSDDDSIVKLSKIGKGGTKDLKKNYKINEPISTLSKSEKVSTNVLKQNEEISEKHKLDTNQKPDPADEMVLKQLKVAKELKEKALEPKERENALEARAREMKAQEKIRQEETRKQKTDTDSSNIKKTLTATPSQMFLFQEIAKEQRSNIAEFKHKAKSMTSAFNVEIIKRLGLDTLPKTGKINTNTDDNTSLLEFMKPIKKIQIQRFLSAHTISCALLDKMEFPVQKGIKRKMCKLDHTKDGIVPAGNSDIFGTGDGEGQGGDKGLEDTETNRIILGAEICKYNVNLLPKQEEEAKPLLFTVLESQKSRDDIKENGNVVIQNNYNNKNEIRAFKKKLEYSHSKGPSTDIPKGVIRYALSDRQFIENGWTMLPTQKVVRKMNVYRMNPTHYDWFACNKKGCPKAYDTGEKLAEIDETGNGRWFYKNGLVSLDYYSAEEMNARRRIVIYSSRLYENSTKMKQPRRTVLACFDWLGNGVVYDDRGNIRLKYNQSEGVIMDKSLGPTTYWKWHALNDPPVLQQVMIDTQLSHKDPEILKYDHMKSHKTIKVDDEQMLAIEHENFLKEKTKKLAQKFKPYQIKSKALKINEQFSLRVLDQASVHLAFRDGKNSLKLNLGMSLDPREIVDTETSDVGEVTSSYDRLPARTGSLANIQRMVVSVKKQEKYRTDRQRRIKRPERQLSVDRIKATIYKPPQLTNATYNIL